MVLDLIVGERVGLNAPAPPVSQPAIPSTSTNATKVIPPVGGLILVHKQYTYHKYI